MKDLIMYITSHKASRIRKKEKMQLVFSRSKDYENSVCGLLSKTEFEKSPSDWLKHEKVLAIFEGKEHVIIIYGG